MRRGRSGSETLWNTSNCSQPASCREISQGAFIACASSGDSYVKRSRCGRPSLGIEVQRVRARRTRFPVHPRAVNTSSWRVGEYRLYRRSSVLGRMGFARAWRSLSHAGSRPRWRSLRPKEPHQRLLQLMGERGRWWRDGEPVEPGAWKNPSSVMRHSQRVNLCAIPARKSVWEPGCGLHQGQRS
jgi:hypothetical protein